jgi:hypothetical protein
MSEQLQNQNKEIHDRPFCRLDTGTSIKGSEVILVVWAHSSPLCKMMGSCKCFLNMILGNMWLRENGCLLC